MDNIFTSACLSLDKVSLNKEAAVKSTGVQLKKLSGQGAEEYNDFCFVLNNLLLWVGQRKRIDKVQTNDEKTLNFVCSAVELSGLAHTLLFLDVKNNQNHKIIITNLINKRSRRHTILFSIIDNPNKCRNRFTSPQINFISPVTINIEFKCRNINLLDTNMRSTFIYPTNNFGHHNNTQYYYYSRYVSQGNNWNGYGLHQVEIRNESDNVVEVVGWTMKEGRVEEDFKTNEVRPGLFYTARLVPMSWGTYKAIIGAVTFRFKGTNQCFTLAFEDPFHDYVHKGYKGHIEEGNDPHHAIAQLKDHEPKEFAWGSYEFKEFEGRGKTVFTIGKRRF